MAVSNKAVPIDNDELDTVNIQINTNNSIPKFQLEKIEHSPSLDATLGIQLIFLKFISH